MGGSVALTLREPNGTEHRMCRWTNILPWAITNLGLIEDRPEHLAEILEQWTSMRTDWDASQAGGVPCQHNMTSVYAPYPFLAPIEYGLVLVDGVHRIILTRQGYTAIGAINPLSVVRGDPADPKSATHRYIALFDAGRIEATAPGRRVKPKAGVSGAESIWGLQACYAQHGYRPFEELDFRVDISLVYQTCRTEAEINAAFDDLERALRDQIDARLTATRQAVLDNLDAEVQDRLSVHQDRAQATLSRYHRRLLALTRHEAGPEARWISGAPRFEYRGALAPRGWYSLDWKDADRHGDVFYRPDHPLARKLIDAALARELPPAAVEFSLSQSGLRSAVLDGLRGQSGWLQVHVLTVDGLSRETFLLVVALADNGLLLDSDVADRLLGLPARITGTLREAPPPALVRHTEELTSARIAEVEARNGAFFQEEAEKLDLWADDLKLGLRREVEQLDREIAEARRADRAATALPERLAAQKRIRTLETQRDHRLRELYSAQDRIHAERDRLIEQIERQLALRHEHRSELTLRWVIY